MLLNCSRIIFFHDWLVSNDTQSYVVPHLQPFTQLHIGFFLPHLSPVLFYFGTGNKLSSA